MPNKRCPEGTYEGLKPGDQCTGDPVTKGIYLGGLGRSNLSKPWQVSGSVGAKELPMLEWSNKYEMFELVRCDRTTGRRETIQDRGQVEGRWPAEAELKKLREANRDPNVDFEIKVVGEKPFRASC